MKEGAAPLTDAATAIEMVNVTVATASDPNSALIEDVNWTVSQGDYWIIGGLPDSGKSDLLSTAAGLTRPARGIHRVLGREIDQLSEDEKIQMRLRVGVVFADEGRLFGHLTIAENLALPICYHRNCRLAEVQERVEQILDMTGLSSLAYSTPRAVNRSLRPRIALARALVLEPELLLLDNPLRGVDPRQSRWWIEFLSALRSGHEIMNGRKTTLVVTADDFRPWAEQGEQFALIKDKQWMLLGERSGLRTHAEPLLHELLSAG